MASIGPLLDRVKRLLLEDQFVEAERVAREILALEPEHHLAKRILGLALRGQDRVDEAIATLRAVVDSHPQDVATLADLGATLAKRREHRQAFHYLQIAARLNPNLPGVMLNLGAVLDEEGHHEEAIQANRHALRLEPTNGLAHYNMGNALRELGRLEEATEHFEAAVRYKPDYIRSRYNMGLCQLLLGRYRDAWPAYELRSSVGEVVVDNYPQPRWDGSSLAGKSLVIHGEQGIGDEVLFASCVPDLVGQASRLALVCEPRLGPLFARSFPRVTVVPFARLNSRDPAPLAEPYDFQIPAGSLPRYLRPDRQDFPRREHFLIADPQQVARWRERFAALGSGLKVGLSWRAGGKSIERRKRSMPLVDWRPILDTPDVCFINLQYSDATDELSDVRSRFGARVHDWEDADPLVDIDGFAAKIAALDLVISVGNATVHLAGALGTPAWTLLPMIPSWRWLAAGEDNPWYASVQLFRQKTSDAWGPTIESIADLLHERVGARRAATRIGAPAVADDNAPPAVSAESHGGAAGRAKSATPDPSDPVQWLKASDLLGHNVADYLKNRVNEAADLVDSKRFAEAEILVREVLQISPRHPRAHKYLGYAAWQTGRLELGIQSFRRALATLGDDHKLHYYLAAVLAQSGRYSEAIVHYRRVMEILPTFRAAHLELGLALQRTGNHVEALAPLRSAQVLDPHDFDAFLHEGRSLMKLARVAPARRAFTKAAELEPRCAATWLELGQNLAFDHEYKLAESCLRRARAIEPQQAAHVDALARVLEATGRKAQALKLYEAALAAAPQDADLLGHAAAARRRRGQNEAAEKLFMRAVALRPGDAELHHALGTTLAEQGRFPAAIALLDRALELEPQRQSARRERSLVNMALSKLRDAWPEYEACAASPPQAPPAAGDIPQWNGEWLENKTILIRAERRLALQLLYATTFGEMIAEAGHCMIECDERLAGLFTRAFPKATICPLDHCEQLLGKCPPRAVDCQIAAVGVMKALRSERARFLRRRPDFKPAPELHRQMQRRLAGLRPGVRVGVARAEGRGESATRESTAMWRSLFAAAPAVQFIDLRSSILSRLPTWLASSTSTGSSLVPANLATGNLTAGNLAAENLHDLGGRAREQELEDVAAIVASLDLVIAEDGPVWPLAGLLDVCTWVICPHAPLGPQWLADAQGRSLWLPNVQIVCPKQLGDMGDLFRQALEKISRRHAGAVDLSEVGKPAGPHWRMTAAVQAER